MDNNENEMRIDMNTELSDAAGSLGTQADGGIQSQVSAYNKVLEEQKQLFEEQKQLLEEQNEFSEKEKPLKADAAEQFTGLPIEALIGKPILAAAKAQQELTAVYIDGIKKLAYKEGKSDGETNVLSFKYNRPIIKADGTVGTQEYSIDAPLLSLVPVPAFTMDEITVDFNMEIKDTDMKDDKTHSDVSTNVSYNSWFGLDSSITGNVSSDSEHKRQTDTTATYKIHARAIQQPPSEGMAKLTSLFAQAMEPLDLSKKKQS